MQKTIVGRYCLKKGGNTKVKIPKSRRKGGLNYHGYEAEYLSDIFHEGRSIPLEDIESDLQSELKTPGLRLEKTSSRGGNIVVVTS